MKRIQKLDGDREPLEIEGGWCGVRGGGQGKQRRNGRGTKHG